MSPAGQRLWSTVAAAHRRVRRDAALAIAGLAAAVVPVVLVIAWVAGGRPLWAAPSPAPLLLELLGVAAAAGIAAWAARRWLSGLTEARIAAAAEASAGLPDGSVRGLLELRSSLPPGTSAALAAKAEAELARRLAGATPEELAGEIGVRASRMRSRILVGLAGLTVATLALGFAAPDRTRAGWTPLLNPVGHLTPPPFPPIAVEPGDAEVARGSDLEVRILAPGRTRVSLRWVARGDVPRQVAVRVEGDAATARLAAIDAPTAYWVVAPDGAVSDTFTVTPVDPLLVSDLVVDVRYPAYLGRAPERYEGDVPPLVVPDGTELEFRGRATRTLAAAELHREGADSRVAFVVDGDRFSGRWTPRSSGVYAWHLAAAAGEAPASVPFPIELVLVPDSAPRVDVAFPGTDTIVPPDQRQAIVAHARDDHGLRSAAVVSWRVSARGEAEPPVEQAIPLGEASLHATLHALLDLSERALLPGDTLYYYVRAVDNAPGGQEGRSPTYALYLPGTEELRALAQAESEALVEELRTAAVSARQLEQSLRDHQRRAAAGGARQSGSAGRPGSTPGEQRSAGTLDHASAESARQLLERQESIVGQLERLRERTDALERALEEAGLNDPELRERMREMRELYDQILTPELREQLAALRQGIEQLDEEQVERALRELAERQQELRERIEQNLELMRRAAVEQQMNALAEMARQLAAQQEALAEAMEAEGEPSSERVEQQERLAEEAGRLSEALSQLEQRLGEMGESGAAARAGEAGDRSREARDDMREAAERAANRQGEQAGEAGQRAAESLARVAESLDETREQLAGEWREEARAAVQQAAMEAIALAERQSELLEEMRRAEAQGDAQGQSGQSGQSGQADRSGQQGQDGRSDQSAATDPRMPSPGQLPGQDAGPQPEAGGLSLPQLPDPTQILPDALPNPQQGDASAGEPGRQTQARPGDAGRQAGEPGRQQGGQGSQDQQGSAGQTGQQGQQGRDAGSGNTGGDQGQSGQEGQGGQTGQGSQGAGDRSGQQQADARGGSQDGAGGQDGLGGQGGSSLRDELRSQQAALDQSIQALARNLSEASQQSAMVSREVSAALARALLSSEETLQALSSKDPTAGLPIEQAERSVEALNQLALALLQNDEQMARSQSGTGLEEALRELAELAQEQGSLSGQGQSLASLGLAPELMQRRLESMARHQQEIAGRIEGVASMLRGGQNDLLGRLEELAREAGALAMELTGGRLTPEVVRRQERLFHRLLDAGRTLERDEVSSERVAQRPGDVGVSLAGPLDPALLDPGDRIRLPDAAALERLPPAMRRLVLEYFDRLNGLDTTGDGGAR